MDMDKLLLRPSEAADVLGLGRAKVYQMCASGELPVIRFGRSVHVPAAQLKALIQRLADEQKDESSAGLSAGDRR